MLGTGQLSDCGEWKVRPNLRRKTKIVCTVGPATGSSHALAGLVRAGMNVARVNLSHGDEEQHLAYIHGIRAVASRLKVPVAILVDLPGPRYRTGDLSDGQANLKRGSRLVLTSRDVPGDQNEVSVNLPDLLRDVSKGDSILLDDGAIRLRVRDTTDTDVVCDVMVGGLLRPRRGIAVPGVKLSAPFLTEQTRRHLEFALEQQVEYVALSFVSKASDVSEIKAIAKETGREVSLIAKIERPEAVRNFDRLLRIADGVMVARGDLGVEMALEKVPLLQKEIIRKCNRAGKPVITATQMLESMVKASRPTRAEVADVANAIYDGTDAVMLSAETAVGSYPAEAVGIMSRIATETEAALPYGQMMAERGDDLESQTDDAIAFSACHTAHQLRARAIMAFTTSGSTAWRVSKYRPRVPIIAITPSDAVRRTLALAWGVHPYRVPPLSHVDDILIRGGALARELGVASEGDLVVITGGVPIGVTGTTNLLKVQEV